LDQGRAQSTRAALLNCDIARAGHGLLFARRSPSLTNPHATNEAMLLKSRTFCTGLTALAAAVALATPSARAADYFAGKSIDLLIGAPAGGGYDIYARALARHYGRHIPGQPVIVSKNMPGAGSARAAGFISTVAPKDGTAIAAIMPGAVMGPLLDEKAEALFDPTKVNYLGTANNGTRVCVSRKDSKIKTFDDAFTQKAAFGGVSSNDSTREYGYMHKNTAGAQYDVVSGYSGTAEIALAMERGEIDGACGWDWSSFKSQRPDWIRDGRVNLLLQVGLEPNAELTRMGVPSVFKYVKSDEARKVVELVISQQVFQRSYIAPPGLPAEQLETLRSAFDATMSDRQFLNDAEKIRIDVSPLSGAKVQALVQKLYATPKDIVARARQAITP
jgi:tripartite-type tricarboxylate transporter receptor subunit TctC